MGFKKVTSGTNYFIVAVLALGILAVINAFSYRHFFRMDLTENKQYTIADSTRKALTELDDIVNIQVYLSKKLPPYLVTITDQVKDMLTEYRIYSEGNIDIEYIDPASDPAIQQKLRFMGIPQLTLNIVEKDKAAVTNVYMGLAVLYGDNKEVIPALTDLATLEYELTSKILRATNSDVQTIGFLSGHGEPDLMRELGTINNELKEQYFTRKVETSKGEKIPEDIAVLVVAGPKKLTDRDLFEIDQYIMSGGKAIFLVDTIDIDQRNLRGLPMGCFVENLIEHYGITVPPTIVQDRLNASASFQSGPYNLFIPYPFWVQTVRQSVETDHPIINSLESMVLPWASPVEIDEEKTKDKEVAVLAKTTEYSWVQEGAFDFSPRREMMPPPANMKQRVMAVAVSGTFASYFADKDIPPVDTGDKDNATKAGEQAIAPDQDRTVIKESPATKIIVVGNSRFIGNNFAEQFDGNRNFFLNAVDWFTFGEQLIGVRSREAGERPLMVVSDSVRNFFRYVNMFGVSVFLALFGLVQFYLRSRRKRVGITLK